MFSFNSVMKKSPLSARNSPFVGEFCTSVLNTMGFMSIKFFTLRSIPFTEGLFLWITVLFSLVSRRALRVLFSQYGLPIPLRIRVTAYSLVGNAFSSPAIAKSRQIGTLGYSTRHHVECSSKHLSMLVRSPENTRWAWVYLLH